jgi:aspartate kinase
MSGKVLVQKFGGTSVATAAARARVVEHVRRAREDGYAVAVVVSALGRRGDPYATDTLLDLLREDGAPVNRADYTLMFVTGEIISTALMSHTLKRAGIPAVGLTGIQAGVHTDGDPTEAEVVEIDTRRLEQHLDVGEVPVITGGQGMAPNGDFNTLGRGASDTSGVALGVALGAERVDIFTDVEGVAAADPRVVASAAFRQRISFDRMHLLARYGAKVVHPRAVLAGWRGATPLTVRSTFSDGPGTWIGPVADEPPFTGIATMNAMTTVTVAGQDLSAELLARWERRRLIMSLDDSASGALVLGAPDAADLAAALDEAGVSPGKPSSQLAWLTLVGDPGLIASRLQADIEVLERAGITIHFRETAGDRATFVVDPPHVRGAVAALHEAYAGHVPA